MQKGKRGFSVRRIKGCRLTECGFQSVGFLRLESNGEDYRPDFTDSRGYFFVPPDSLAHELVLLSGATNRSRLIQLRDRDKGKNHDPQIA